MAPFGVCPALDGAPAHLFTATLLAVWISIFVYLAQALNGHTVDRVLLLLGNARMVDTLRRARDAADDANRAKTRFLATMSHELRTPLNAIIGFSDINRSGSHLLRLINDILDVAKIEVGGQPLNETVVDLVGTLKQSGQLMDAQARAAGVTLSVDASPRLPGLRADATRFRQIVINLLSNAVKFTPAGGRVLLSVGIEHHGGLLLQVRDTGIGMKPEDIPRAMEAFVQLDQAAPRGDPGTGLGLALVKTLLDAHGGSIAIDSEPGKGTLVSVRLPQERLAPSAMIEAPRKVA